MDKHRLQARRLEVANAIRSWRSARRITQAELACLLEVPQSWVSNVESGARRLDVVEAEAVANALEISLDQLLYHRGPFR